MTKNPILIGESLSKESQGLKIENQEKGMVCIGSLLIFTLKSSEVRLNVSLTGTTVSMKIKDIKSSREEDKR